MKIETTPSNDTGRDSARNTSKPVHFFCAAPQAHKVELEGDFNDWQPWPMTRFVDGWWSVLVEMDRGNHLYRFLLDGQPMLDLQAGGIASDERNERVSLIAVS